MDYVDYLFLSHKTLLESSLQYFPGELTISRVYYYSTRSIEDIEYGSQREREPELSQIKQQHYTYTHTAAWSLWIVEVLGLNCVTVAEFVARSRVGTHTTLSIYSTTLHTYHERSLRLVVYHQSDDDDDGSKRGALELQYFGWGFCHCFTFV